jgi:hypothetical protein
VWRVNTGDHKGASVRTVSTNEAIQKIVACLLHASHPESDHGRKTAAADLLARAQRWAGHSRGSRTPVVCSAQPTPCTPARVTP